MTEQGRKRVDPLLEKALDLLDTPDAGQHVESLPDASGNQPGVTHDIYEEDDVFNVDTSLLYGSHQEADKGEDRSTVPVDDATVQVDETNSSFEESRTENNATELGIYDLDESLNDLYSEVDLTGIDRVNAETKALTDDTPGVGNDVMTDIDLASLEYEESPVDAVADDTLSDANNGINPNAADNLSIDTDINPEPELIPESDVDAHTDDFSSLMGLDSDIALPGEGFEEETTLPASDDEQRDTATRENAADLGEAVIPTQQGTENGTGSESETVSLELDSDLDAVFGNEDTGTTQPDAAEADDFSMLLNDDNDEPLLSVDEVQDNVIADNSVEDSTSIPDAFDTENTDPADIMADMVYSEQENNPLSEFMPSNNGHYDQIETLGAMGSSDDLKDFLDNLDLEQAPADLPVQNNDIPQQGANDSHQESQPTAQTERTEIASNTMAQSTPENAADAALHTSTIENRKMQKSGLVAMAVAAMLGAGGGFGLSIAYEKFSTSPSDQAVTFIQEEALKFEKSIKALQEKATQLESRLLQSDSVIVRIEQEHIALTKEKDELVRQQKALHDDLNNVKLSADQYEQAMVSRLETLLKLTQGVTAELSTQETRLKDTLFRETMAALEAKGDSTDNGKVKQLIGELAKNNQRLEQIEVNLRSQKTLLSLMGDETEYVKSRLGQIELTGTGSGSSNVVTDPPKNKVATEQKKEPSQKAAADVKDPTWSVDVKPQPSSNTPGYTLIGVLQKSPGVFEIYLQSNNAKSATEYETYLFSQAERSVIPGYGVIKGVQAVSSNTTVVPYQILTESGMIVGRQKKSS